MSLLAIWCRLVHLSSVEAIIYGSTCVLSPGCGKLTGVSNPITVRASGSRFGSWMTDTMIPSSDNRVRKTVPQHYITPSLPLLWWAASPRRHTITHTLWLSQCFGTVKLLLSSESWVTDGWIFHHFSPSLSFLLYYADTLTTFFSLSSRLLSKPQSPY